MRILLDTVAFLWLTIDAPQLSENAKASPPQTFVPSLREQLSVETLPLDEPSTLQLAKLPDLHRDPFDRMLVCQSIEHGMTLLTPDDMVREYPIRSFW